MGIAAGTLPAQLGTAARAPIAALEIAATWDFASVLTCSIMASTSMWVIASAGRMASSALMADSAQPTTAAISASMAPSVAAHASRHAAASATWPPTSARFTKYFVHAPDMRSARSPLP